MRAPAGKRLMCVLGAAVVWAAVLLCSPQAVAGEVVLEPLSTEPALPGADLLPAVTDAELVLAPGAGKLVVLGNFTSTDFAVDRADQLRLTDAGGRELPLLLDASGTVREFGRIVAVRLAFEIAAGADSGAPFTLSWGDSVKGSVRELRSLALAPAAAGNWCGFRWRAPGDGKPAGDLSVASVEIVADSNANYYSLWYLLPMALIFAILTLRKFAKPAA